MAITGARSRLKDERRRHAVAAGRQLKTAELVALDIVRDIVGQSLKPGDPLPLEPEMLAHYGVSRSSLREGLRLLETQGLITIRPGPGAGTVVSDVSPHNLGRTMTLHFHMANSSYDELLRTWSTLEPIVAELAARNPDEARRREAMKPFLNGIAEDCMPAISAGLSFHDAVADLAENATLSILCRAVGFIVSDQVLASGNRQRLETFIVDEHADLARSIIAGDALRTADLMRQHIAHLIEDFQAYWPTKIGERIAWQ
jgi:DNA-binding FadR family transcriptional regulator